MARANQQIEPPLDPWAAVEQFRSLARKAFGRSFKGLILYGSYARGEGDAGSDIDILVLFKDKGAVERGRQKLGKLSGDLSLDRGEVISAMAVAEADYRRGRSPFFLNVKREGIFIMSEEAFEVKPEIERLLELADVSLAAARSLFREEEEFARFAASRGYYAMFYAAEAVLLSKGLSFSRHSAVIAAFGQHFAGEELLPSELHTNLQSAFRHRNLGDYSTDPFLGETADRILRDATAFVDSVRAYLRPLLASDE